ncbi:MAG: hypothetical protein ACREVJ_07880 [Gammaproteobacteria bacterium]
MREVMDAFVLGAIPPYSPLLCAGSLWLCWLQAMRCAMR